MPSRNTRARANHPPQPEENSGAQSRPSTASGNSSHSQGSTQLAAVPFSQPSQADSQQQFPYSSAENAIYEASLQLRNPNGFPTNPPDQYQLNMANGTTSRPSTSGPPLSHSRESSQQVSQFQQYGHGEPQNGFGYQPSGDVPYSTNPYHSNVNIDPSLQPSQSSNPQPLLQRFNSDQFSRNSPANDFGTTFQAFTAPNGVEGDGQKKKGASSSATNDKELRELLAANDGRTLRDVATEVLKTERTPKAEKTKQLFAMLWFVPMPLTAFD